MNLLQSLTDWAATASFRAGLLVLAVMIIQFLARDHLSAKWRYRLWLPVLLVLLTPAFLESRLSVGSLFAAPPQALESPGDSQQQAFYPTEIPALQPAPEMVEVSQSFESTSTPTEGFDSSALHLEKVWAVGCVILLSGGLLSYTTSLRKFRRQRVASSETVINEVHELTNELCLSHAPEILASRAIPSPAVTGLFRPLLLLPANFGQGLSSDERHFILKHELMHLKRGDLKTNFLLCLLMAIHWFNPLLWLAFFKCRTDREAACDAQVLRHASPSTRHAYGNALLKIESAFSSGNLSLGFVGIFQKGNALRSRVRSIASGGHTHPVMPALASVFIMILAFLGMTQAQTEDSNSSDTFHLGQAVFRTGDLIQIKSVERNNDGLSVTGNYELVTHEKASLMLSITQTQKNLGSLRIDPRQSQEIQAGRGSFKLLMPDLTEGIPHISFYTAPTDSATKSVPFGAVYFGTREEADASINLQLGYLMQGWKLQNFVTGQAAFRLGDSIHIRSITRTTDIITVSGDYTLATEDSARLSFYITGDIKNPPFDQAQEMTLQKGRGTFTLSHPKPYPGMPHLTFYRNAKPGESGAFGALYFGHLSEAQASRKLDLSYMLDSPVSKSAKVLQEEKMNRILMRNMLTVGMSLQEAANYLQTESQKLDQQESDPVKRGIKIHVNSNSSVKMSLMLKDMSFIEAVRYITSISGTRYWVDAEGVHIVDADRGNQNPTLERMKELIVPQVQFSGATLEEAFEFLQMRARTPTTQGKGSKIRFVLKNITATPSSLTMDLKNVPLLNVVKYVTELSGTHYRIEGDDVIIEPLVLPTPSREAVKTPSVSPKQGKATERARKIILPQVQFAGATLEEAAEFLRLSLMYREDDNQLGPINIILKPEAGKNAQLSLDLKDVSLWEALRYVAELSNSMLSSDDYALIIEPK